MNKQKEITKEDDIKALIKNFNLLRIVEKIEARKSVINQGSFMNDKDKSLKNIFIEEEKEKTEEQKRKSSLKSFSNEQNLNNINDFKCKKHNLSAHSYAVGTNLYFCELCSKETKLKISPIPSVIPIRLFFFYFLRS